MTFKFALAGMNGRMGKMITQVTKEDSSNAHIVASTTRNDNPQNLFTDEVQTVIDFTSPDAGMEHLKLACEHQKPIVIGTTGFTDDQEDAIRDAGKHTTVLRCANTSLGITMLSRLIPEVTKALGPDWDIEINETHHKHKVDAPSGTALALGEAVAAGRGVPLNDIAVWERHGITGAREAGTVGFSVMRGGDVVGEHSVVFYNEGERIEITHRAMSRLVFARGAVKAAIWAATAQHGYYTMQDVLN